MTRAKRFGSMQALTWLNAIAEDDSGDKNEGQNVCEGLDLGSANSEQVQSTWEVISSDESDLETDIDDLQQTESASCQLVSFGTDSNDTSNAVEVL